jgi:hypothetical protein
MDIGEPLNKYGATKISELREKVLLQPGSFWEVDQLNRAALAGDRAGTAVFFYNDMPACVDRGTLQEAKSGYVNVLRYADRPLFAEIQQLVDAEIKPHFAKCDIMRVQLAELPPGGIITPHRDVNILAAVHRLHVPLVTHKGVKFIIAGQNFFLEEGILYDLNNVVLHSVENKSGIMRIHLLVDMIPHSIARAHYHDTEKAMVSAVAASRAMAKSAAVGFMLSRG